MDEPREVRTTCTRDCPDGCGIVATVEDGRIVRLRGDPEHGVTRGVLCARGNRYLARFYDPERVLHPLRRSSDGTFRRISWDEALDLVAEKLRARAAADGPLSVLAVTYSGIHTWIPRVLWRLFWAHAGGATFARGGLSVEAAWAAQEIDFGSDCTHQPEDLVNARGFAIWGKNLVVTRQHWLHFVKQARRRGAPLWVVDPLPSATAKMADRHLALRPGSDWLLAVGVGRLLLERGAVDEDFVRNHVSGFEGYSALVRSRSLSEVAAGTDLPLAEVEALADLYAGTKPLCTMIGLGLAYWERGGESTRLVDALAAITGNVGVSGGGACTDYGAASGFDMSAVRDAPSPKTRTVLLPRLGDEILGATDPPLRMGWIAGANPVATCPNTRRVAEGLRSLDFLVVVDQFMTATAKLADLVLPCTTFLEADDLATAYGHAWVGITRAVVPPLGEALPDARLYQLLAERLGFGDALAGDAETWMRRLLAPVAAEGLSLEALRERPRRHPRAKMVPFADRAFATSSGKFEIIGRLADDAALPADLVRRTAVGEPAPLRLMATKTLRFVNSQVLPADLPDEPRLRIHPEALAARGLPDGGTARAVTETGELRVRLVADSTLREDVALLNPALWRGDASGVNQLREARIADLGEGAAFHETLVTVLPDR